MFRGIIFLPLSIVSAILAFYLANYILSPFNSDETINEGNVILLLFITSLFIATAVAFSVSIIDKIFFKKFYEEPSLQKAIKYGFIIASIFFLNSYLKLINQGNQFILIFSLLIIVLMVILDFVEARKKKDAYEDNIKEIIKDE